MLQVEDKVVSVDGVEVRDGVCSIPDALDHSHQTHIVVVERRAEYEDDEDDEDEESFDDAEIDYGAQEYA